MRIFRVSRKYKNVYAKVTEKVNVQGIRRGRFVMNGLSCDRTRVMFVGFVAAFAMGGLAQAVTITVGSPQQFPYDCRRRRL